MGRLFTAVFTAGLLFGLGLGIAEMTRPAKVINFLDITGAWDPSLAFVMVGAIGIHFIVYRFVLKRPSPIFFDRFMLPEKKTIDKRLVIGAVLFGMGWGMGGFCPGPAVAGLASLQGTVFIFVISMLAGMLAFEVFDRVLKGGTPASP